MKKKLEKNAPFEDAIDVFKYRGKKYPIDTEDYNREIPAVAEDYEHVCRFPYGEMTDFFASRYRGGSFDMSAVSALISARRPDIKAFKNKYCTGGATRLREPDIVCLPKRGGRYPSCRYLIERSMESIAEVGGGRYAWAHPYLGKKKMIPEPWREFIIREMGHHP